MVELAGLLDNVKGVLKKNMYALALTGKGGQLVFGSIPSAWQASKFVYTPALQNELGHWTVDASINGQKVPNGAIIDSATASLMVEHDLAIELFKNASVKVETFDDLSLGTFPCGKPPKLTVKVGTLEVDLDPSTVSLGKDDRDPTSCYWAVIALGAEDKIDSGAIYGAPLLKSEQTLCLCFVRCAF